MSASLDLATRGTTAAPNPSLQSRLRRGAKSSVLWIIAVVVLLVIAIVTTLSDIGKRNEEPLHFDATDPSGGKAFVQMLRTHGVDVTTTESFETARSAAAKANTTVLIFDQPDNLSTERIGQLRRTLASAGGQFALIAPGKSVTDYNPRVKLSTADVVYPEANNEGTRPPVAPACTYPAAQRAGTVESSGDVYQTDSGVAGVHTCYPAMGPGQRPIPHAGELLIDAQAPVPTTVFSNQSWFENSELDALGHAALIAGTLSQADHLVYYIPEYEASAADQGLSSMIPDWFGAASLWLIPLSIIMLLAAGRRFGPLAVERLPAIVPPIETVLGRAGLAQRSQDRSGALHTIRTAALVRMARTLRLAAHTSTAEIVAQVAQTTGQDPAWLNHVLITGVPRTDAELVELSTAVNLIESEVCHL